jgi:hypothetical protein
MYTITIQKRTNALQTTGVSDPESLLHLLIEQGVGCLEASAARDAAIVWSFTSRLSRERKEVATTPAQLFRPLLARFAVLMGLSPYGGHILFGLRIEGEDAPRPERFSLYLCNEPTMGIWIKLYLYCIDGVWPMPLPAGDCLESR